MAGHRLNTELKKQVRMDRLAEGWPKPTNLQELEERIRFEVSRSLNFVAPGIAEQREVSYPKIQALKIRKR